jgi:hypothetical protein
MDKVHLVGSKSDTVPYIALADVGIMASRREAFGRATFECLAAGTPVIGADSGATPEMVVSGENGYLHEQGSPESLAEKITEYLRDRSLLETHGAAGRRTAEAMMGGEHTADALYERIRHLVGTKPEPPAQPIHYLHQWYFYLEAAHRTMRKAHTFSLLRVLLVRAKAVIRPRYYRLRSLLTHLRGR